MQKGVLLLNLGTPDDFSVKAVRRYLREFLSDRRVITLPSILRWIIVYGLILPFRPKQTAHAYRQIWTEQGSPLLIHSKALQKALAEDLKGDYQVALAMRYGNPSIKKGLDILKACEKIIIIPLYPQYASATTGSTFEAVFQSIKRTELFPEIHIKQDFYANPDFIQAQANIISEHIDEDDFLLLSYHGLPESHLKPAGCITPCEKACTAISKHPLCYRAQCYETSRLIQEALNLPEWKMDTSFQSRLGRTPWIKPYTDEILKTLREKEIENLAVACPSFVSDCLETLEEIGMRLQEEWLKLGGNSFKLIPCLNDNEEWVSALAGMTRTTL